MDRCAGWWVCLVWWVGWVGCGGECGGLVGWVWWVVVMMGFGVGVVGVGGEMSE